MSENQPASRATRSLAISALECRLRQGRAAFTLARIASLVEYAVGPRLPLTSRLNIAVGVHAGSGLLSVSVGSPVDGATRTTTGLLILNPGTEIPWAFEIAAPLGLVEIEQLGEVPTAGNRWVRTATLDDGRRIPWIDLEGMVAELGSPPGSSLAARAAASTTP